jgi:hypothetical protein
LNIITEGKAMKNRHYLVKKAFYIILVILLAVRFYAYAYTPSNATVTAVSPNSNNTHGWPGTCVSYLALFIEPYYPGSSIPNSYPTTYFDRSSEELCPGTYNVQEIWYVYGSRCGANECCVEISELQTSNGTSVIGAQSTCPDTGVRVLNYSGTYDTNNGPLQPNAVHTDSSNSMSMETNTPAVIIITPTSPTVIYDSN